MAPTARWRCGKMLHGRLSHPQIEGQNERFQCTIYVNILRSNRFAAVAEA